MIFTLLLFLRSTYGQEYSNLNLDSLYQLRIALENEPSGPKSKDSLYFLDINIINKMKILKHKRNYSTPFVFIDFPFYYYDSIAKAIKLTNFSNEPYDISDSTIAIIRVGYTADSSYGSGGASYLIELNKFSSELLIDSLIMYDSISSTGVFYFNMQNQKLKLEINREYLFVDHKEVKTETALFDYITEYAIKNHGKIRRQIE